MVSEVVMYQSMFVLGILTFGFFAVSFGNYSDYAEDVTIENNLERVLQEVGEEIINLIASGREARGSIGTVEIDISIHLDASYAGTPYIIETRVDDGYVDLVALVKDSILVRHPLGLPAGLDPSVGQIDFTNTGSLLSGDKVPTITYLWDSTGPTEQILFT